MSWRIGQVEQMTGLSADTLRYYERIGLLPPPQRSSGGSRIYRDCDLQRLRFIKRAQQVGFTLDEIGSLLGFREDPAGSCREVRQLAASKHQWITHRMRDLERMEAELALLLSICTGDQDGCPILEHLNETH